MIKWWPQGQRPHLLCVSTEGKAQVIFLELSPDFRNEAGWGEGSWVQLRRNIYYKTANRSWSFQEKFL